MIVDTKNIQEVVQRSAGHRHRLGAWVARKLLGGRMVDAQIILLCAARGKHPDLIMDALKKAGKSARYWSNGT